VRCLFKLASQTFECAIGDCGKDRGVKGKPEPGFFSSPASVAVSEPSSGLQFPHSALHCGRARSLHKTFGLLPHSGLRCLCIHLALICASVRFVVKVLLAYCLDVVSNRARRSAHEKSPSRKQDGLLVRKRSARHCKRCDIQIVPNSLSFAMPFLIQRLFSRSRQATG
jgi:hypothetical protein